MADTPQTCLDQISTRWSSVSDPMQFVLRYAPAVRGYLGALLPNAHDADEVAQDFLVRVIQKGFALASPDRGRFRDYLRAAVRNAAFSHLRRKRPCLTEDALLAAVPAPKQDDAERDWVSDWRTCVLNRAWRALEQHEREAEGNLSHTVLRATVDHPEADSKALAERIAKSLGRPLTPEAFRKQVSRARRRFAQILVEEIRQTLEDSSPERVEEELAEVGLMEYVREFLPHDWRAGAEIED